MLVEAPNLVDAVQNAMATQQTATGNILVFHPPTTQEPWSYTRTLQFTLSLTGFGTRTVRGHVHYDAAGGGAGPGNYWISGHDNWSARTPSWVVTAYATAGLGERQGAVTSYNSRHHTHHPVPTA